MYEADLGRGRCEQMSQNNSRGTGMYSPEKWERKRLRKCRRQSARGQ